MPKRRRRSFPLSSRPRSSSKSSRARGARPSPHGSTSSNPNSSLAGRKSPWRAWRPLRGRGAAGSGPGPHRRAGEDGRAPDHGARSRKKSLGLAPLGPEARRQVVLTLAADYPLRLICRATGWRRSTIYHEAADEGRLRRAIGRLAASWPTYGYRRLTLMLRREGWPVNAKRVRRLMAEMGLKGKAPVRRGERPTAATTFPATPTWSRH
jgi:hypothetical protein